LSICPIIGFAVGDGFGATTASLAVARKSSAAAQARWHKARAGRSRFTGRPSSS
jgi:hypothetical protein